MGFGQVLSDVEAKNCALEDKSCGGEDNEGEQVDQPGPGEAKKGRRKVGTNVLAPNWQLGEIALSPLHQVLGAADHNPTLSPKLSPKPA